MRRFTAWQKSSSGPGRGSEEDESFAARWFNAVVFWRRAALPMSRLGITSILLGLAIVAARLPGIIAPAKFRERSRKFPRSVFWGRLLLAVVALWCGIVLFRAATGDWAWAQPLVIVGVPVAYWLVINYAEQFLAVRAFAALSLLIAKVVVDAADSSELTARLFVTGLAYVWVVVALWMAIAPHQTRDWIEFFTRTDARCRLACSVGAAVGLVLIALGLFVY
jgi:hypothetical protein